MVLAAAPRPTHSLTDSWTDLRSSWMAGVRNPHRPDPYGMPVLGAGGDYHYANENEFLRIMELVRHYERNDPIVQSALARLTTNVCQRGFTLDPQSTDEKVNKRLLKDWRAWSKDPRRCCRRGKNTFNDMVAIVFRSMVRDGDACVVPLQSGSLKVYEAHRLRTPSNTTRNVVHGILMDDHRRPREYWFTKEAINPRDSLTYVSDVERIGAFDPQGNPQVFHVSRAHRDSQARGVSWLAPSIDYVEMSSNIQFAKMVQQQTVSCYSLINTRSQNFNPADADADDDGKAFNRDAHLQKMHRDISQIGPGMIYDTLPGETLTGFSPNVPNAEFFAHAKMLLQFLAVNLDMPVQLLLLDPSDSNFSSWRGSVDQARLSWRVMQEGLIHQLHSPAYQWWIRRKLATEPWLQEAFASGVDVYAHEWKAPAWSYIDPAKDAIADDLIIRSGMASRRRLMANLGISYDEEMPAIFQELESEVWEFLAMTGRLNQRVADEKIEVGSSIDWRELAAMRGGASQQHIASLTGVLGDAEPAKKPAKEAA